MPYSADYDPKAAHEYYMKHRKLKGRRSTRKLSDEGKERFAYAKYQLTEQKKARIAKARERNNAVRDQRLEMIEKAKKEQKEQLASAAKEKIAMLRDMLKGLPKEVKEKKKAHIQGLIDNIKGKLSDMKKRIDDDAKSQKNIAREQTKAANKKDKEQATKEYEAALDKAYADIKKQNPRRGKE